VTTSSNPEQLLSRRRLVLAGAVLATAGVAWSWFASLRSPRAETAAKRTRRRTGKLPIEDLMKPGPVPDLALGKADAPVTIVEYASMTCPACANFHNSVLPVLKEKYIDKGLVRLVYREFLLNERDAVASMVARCAGSDKSLPLVTALFAKQQEWAQATTDFLPKLYAFAQQVGLTRQSFNKCQQNEKLLKDLVAQRERGAAFGVSRTPTFFINGKKLEGGTVEDFDKAIGPFLNRG
jgi:protein-disulfide isomerase